MLLEVRPSNTSALRLYERMGFLRVGLRRRYYPAQGGTREDAIVMTRPLAGEAADG
jgi:ribosomal protein S18 acetylase RimI-like enzyme